MRLDQQIPEPVLVPVPKPKPKLLKPALALALALQNLLQWVRTLVFDSSRLSVSREHEIDMDIPSRSGGGYLLFNVNVVLIVCCSPLSRTPSHPHILIIYHVSHITLTGTAGVGVVQPYQPHRALSYWSIKLPPSPSQGALQVRLEGF